MADTKVSALTTTNTDPQTGDLLYIVDDPGGAPQSEKIALSTLRDAFEDGGALELVAISATNLTAGTIPAARIGADTIDAITEIAAALKSGLDLTLITGTAGTSGDLSQWNADGDLVDGPTPPSGTIVGTTDTQTLSGKTIGDFLTMVERSADPSNPSEGNCKLWLSDGTGSGSDGDLMVITTAGGVTKKGILMRFSSMV